MKKNQALCTNLIGREVIIYNTNLPKWDKYKGQSAIISAMWIGNEGPEYVLLMNDGRLMTAWDFVFTVITPQTQTPNG